MTSYTVVSGLNGDEIVQFREQSAILDIDMMRIAKDIHRDFVPRCSHLGWVGHPDSSSLAVYGMSKLPGVNYITARSSFIGNKRLQLNTVYSLARFVETISFPIRRFNPANIIIPPSKKKRFFAQSEGHASGSEQGIYICYPRRMLRQDGIPPRHPP